MAGKIRSLPQASKVLSKEREQEIAELSKTVFDRLPERVAFPGGKSRSAFLVDMGDKYYIYAKRGRRGDARVESRVLKALQGSGFTPELTAVAGEWVVQEYLSGIRLPVYLNQLKSMSDREQVVGSAIESLINIYRKAEQGNLADHLPAIGEAREWFYSRTGAAKRMSNDLKLPVPNVDRNLLTDIMHGPRDRFMKYDARPGNALVDGSHVYWFDWEDCGAGDPIEDLAFILCDEWMNLDASAESRLIERFLPFFAHERSLEEVRRQLTVYGLVHVTVRLRMALKYRCRDKKWWDRDVCLAGDKVGNTPTETARLCDRGIRWAGQLPELHGFTPWFREIIDYFELPKFSETLPELQVA